MKNLDRNSNSASPHQISAYQQGKLREEIESRKKQAELLYAELEREAVEKEKLKHDAKKSDEEAKLARKKSSQLKQANEGLLQRLMNAIRSRNSMRGRLGNMTAQRNRALRQVETLAAQNKEVFQQLKNTTDKLGEAYQQITILQDEYDQDMTEIAQSYQELSLEKKQLLPLRLKQLLDQIEENYNV